MKTSPWPIIVLAAVAFQLGCTTYNVKIKPMGKAKPIINCDKAVQKDEGGVCYDFFGCADGMDRTKCDWELVE